MFRANETHEQQDFFGLEAQLSPEALARLKGTREYAFYRQVFLRIPEALFAELYSADQASRPNAPVNVMVGALILQHLNDWTFEELFDHVAFDLRTRAALGLWNLSGESFSRATLFRFQHQLRDHFLARGEDKFQAVFDRLTEEDLKRFGLRSGIQRGDSTQIGSNIRQYTRIELLVEVAMRMWRVLDEADQQAHAERFAEFVRPPTSGQYVYRLKKSEIDPVLERLGQLYAWMAEALEAGYGGREIHGIVRRVFAEQFVREREKVVVRAVREIATDSLQSPDDPEATFRRKDDEGHRGYVLHAAETADPQNPLQLLTDVVVEANNRDDSRILGERLDPMKRKTPGLEELHVDGAYPSRENDRKQAELGIAVVQTGIRGLPPRAPVRIEPLETGFHQVTCAAGFHATSERARVRFKATFARAGCAACPLAGVCPAKPRAGGGRIFYFTRDDARKWIRHHRLGQLPPERRNLRANVEATMKEFKAPCRNGKLRTRGRAAAAQYAFLRAIAINFGRIHRHLRSRTDDSGLPAPASPAPSARKTASPAHQSPNWLDSVLAALTALAPAAPPSAFACS